MLDLSHADSLFTNEEQKMVGCDVFDTSATQSGLVPDITDNEHMYSDCGAKNGHTHTHVV